MKMTIYEKEDLIGQLRYCRAWAKQCEVDEIQPCAFFFLW